MSGKDELGTCEVPWPVCPNCIGEGLATSAGVSTCRSCGRSWPETDVTPCPRPATTLLTDGEMVARVCRSHAAHPSARKLRPEQRGHLQVLHGGRPDDGGTPDES